MDDFTRLVRKMLLLLEAAALSGMRPRMRALELVYTLAPWCLSTMPTWSIWASGGRQNSGMMTSWLAVGYNSVCMRRPLFDMAKSGLNFESLIGSNVPVLENSPG